MKSPHQEASPGRSGAPQAASHERRYSRALNESDLDPDPIVQFKIWFEEAARVVASDPTAMTLATATREGAPSARMVLLKDADERGFVFFTNYLSRKSLELAENPQAALVFYWAELDRQVRITGRVTRTGTHESDAYFRTRPFESRIGAIASPQSDVVPDRETLERRFAELLSQYREAEVPRPAHWGGYRLEPGGIEFWQGRLNRMHDRLRYTRQRDGRWAIERLAP